MTSKKILLAASAVSALAMAGGAHAITLTGSVATKTVDSSTVYTIASEKVVSSTSSTSGAVTLTATLSTAAQQAIGANTTGTYDVTFSIDNGSLATPTVVSATGTNATCTTTPVTVSSKSLHYVFTCSSTAAETITGFTVTDSLTVSSQATTTASASVNLVSGGATFPLDGGSSSIAIVKFAPAINTAFSSTVTSASATASLTGSTTPYTTFTSTPGTATVQVKLNSTTGQAGGAFYTDLSSTSATVAGIISTGTIVLTGANVGSLTEASTQSGGAALATAPTTSSGSTTVTATGAELAQGVTVTFSEPTPTKVVSSGSVTATISYTDNTGFNAPTSTVPSSGTIYTFSLQGTTINAPWFGGPAASQPATVRITNSGSSAVSGIVTVTNAIGATNAGNACAITLQPGENLFNTAAATSCFGSSFKRGDLQFNLLTTSGSLGAKMRIQNTDGSVSETSLGVLDPNAGN